MTLSETQLLDVRRHLHQIPELALQEVMTHDFLLDQIQQLATPFVDIRAYPDLPTAIFVKIHGTASTRTIGYRADMDALPVTETTGLSFASTHPGIAHACGHDIHMTVALGIYSYFVSHRPQNDLIIFFQPAEEAEAGGKRAYDAGAFTDDWAIDEFYGLHDNPDLPAGAIGVRQGTLFAGTTEVDVAFTGHGGHAAFPQDANDMVVAASAFVMQAQTIISRNVNPIESGVITFGKLEAGSIRNVIAGTARLEGTIRGLDQAMIQHIQERLVDLGEGIARSFNCQVTVTLNQGGYFPVQNNPVTTAAFIQYFSQQKTVPLIETAPAMTGEDFGYLLDHIPGTMFWLGVDDTHQLHDASFSPNEQAIARGVTAISGFLAQRLTNEKGS